MFGVSWSAVPAHDPSSGVSISQSDGQKTKHSSSRIHTFKRQILEKIERNRHRPASVAEQCDSDSVTSRGKVGEAWDEHPRLV